LSPTRLAFKLQESINSRRPLEKRRAFHLHILSSTLHRIVEYDILFTAVDAASVEMDMLGGESRKRKAFADIH